MWEEENVQGRLGHGRYPSDDINKFLWMVRIGGGVYPEIKERDYLGNGNYRVDGEAGKVCFFCFYRPERLSTALNLKLRLKF